MITHLRGKLVEKAPTTAVVDVNGVGYKVAISLVTYEKLPLVDADILVFTHHYVREDRMDLFGFADKGEREVFELLIGVSGIGPNSAQTILSGMTVDDLRQAVLHERVGELTAIKGIGRKTAERLVIELRDKMPPGEAVAGAENTEGEKDGQAGAVEEAVLALVALGLPSPAARQSVNKVVAKNGEFQSVQQLIKQALKER
jgi:Holliday junction DNA helicase RuvA